MKFNPDIHHRRSIRLKGYDYSQAGAYFVTICTHGGRCLFGDVLNEEVKLNEIGELVEQVWGGLPERFPAVELDQFVVMPNHLHGIIVIVGAGQAPPTEGAASSAPTLPNVIRAFKSISGIHANRLLLRKGRRLWQRDYYEHIIRNEAELDRIREYIFQNPIKWTVDPENPDAKPAAGEEPWR